VGLPRDRSAAARQTSAYRCFLPDLAGLGGACPHGSWHGATYVNTPSGKWSSKNHHFFNRFISEKNTNHQF